MDEERVVEQNVVEERPVEEPVVAAPAAAVVPPSRVVSGSVVSESVRRTPSGGETARRMVVFIFGIVQALIVLRIVLLLADASQGNGIVRFIYDLSGVFVAPFEGILHTNAVQSGVTILDIAALVALVGWTILEFLVIAGIGIFRREP
ncbi:MAG: YggT family protein [Chloroflexota bacterium]